MRLDSIGLEELAPWSKYSGAGSVISCSIPWYSKGQKLPAPVSLGTPMICSSVYCPLRMPSFGRSDSSPVPIYSVQVILANTCAHRLHCNPFSLTGRGSGTRLLLGRKADQFFSG